MMTGRHGVATVLALAIGTCASICACITAHATDYHVSSSLGDDSLDGQAPDRTAAHGPFATLQRLGSVPLGAGDRVLLRCGDRFAGPWAINLMAGGTGELALGGYGECTGANRPVIDGRVLLAAALPDRAASPSQPQSFESTTQVVQVFAGDRLLPEARYPISAMLLVPDGTGPASEELPHVPALAGRSVDGALLHARTQEWFIEERRVVAGNGRLDAPLRYPLRPRTGFYLTGKAWMLSDQPAWVNDAIDRRLLVSGSGRQPLYKVPIGPLFQVSGRGSVSLTGVDFDAAGGDAVSCRVDGTVRMRDVSVRRAYGNGIAVAGAISADIADSAIEDVGLDGIFFAEVQRATVRRNRVVNAGLYGGPRPSLAAINAHRTDSAAIEDNLIDGAAYHGIRFAGDASVLRNIVNRSCLRLSDCGGIYTWRRNVDDRRPPAVVRGNLVNVVRGDTSVKLGVNDWFVGIYLDDFSNNVSVTQNVVVGANQGVYLHNAWGNEVSNNVVRALQKTFIEAGDAHKSARDRLRDNSVHDNAELLGDYAATLRDGSSVAAAFGTEGRSALEIRPFGGAAGALTGAARHCSALAAPQATTSAPPVAAFSAIFDCN